MNHALIFLPVLVQMLLTLALYVALQRVKSRAARAGEVDETRRALHDDAWPDYVRRVNNNIRNQFELPVLFYVLCMALWALQAAGTLAQVLAWVFVLSRIAHAWVHTRSNVVPLRRRIFTLGVVLLLVLWLLAAWRLIGGILAA
jgi:hypothetical protein